MSLKEEVEEMEEKIKQLEKENEALKKEKPNWIESAVLDKAMTHGVVAINKLPEGYQRARCSIELLSTIINMMKKLNKEDDVWVFVKDDYPILLTENKDSRYGLVLAPKVSDY